MNPKNLIKLAWATLLFCLLFIIISEINSYASEPEKPPLNPSKTLFVLNGLSFIIPLEGLFIDDFLDRSIGFIPEDMIRDGLPIFGSKRDDWKGKTRRHLGYDIYVDHINVLAVADGVVTKIETTQLAGLYIKLHHGNEIYSTYVHVANPIVRSGQAVKQGEVIARIEGPGGNAIAPQLHLELKVNNRSVDPLLLIEKFYKNDSRIMQKIATYKELMAKTALEREQKVKEFLENQQ